MRPSDQTLHERLTLNQLGRATGLHVGTIIVAPVNFVYVGLYCFHVVHLSVRDTVFFVFFFVFVFFLFVCLFFQNLGNAMTDINKFLQTQLYQ